MSKIELKPCPFCGGKPNLYGEEIRDYVETDDESMNSFHCNGWAKATRKEYWVRPNCLLQCPLGNAYELAYGITKGRRYNSPITAANAWNKRVAEE